MVLTSSTVSPLPPHDFALIRFVIFAYLPSFLSWVRYARPRLPCSGSLGPWFPTFPALSSPRYYAQLRLPNIPPGSFATRYLPGTLLCPSSPFVSSTVRETHPWGGASPQAPGFCLPDRTSSYLAFSTRRYLDLPGSWTVPVDSCPALRPRWCVISSPYRLWHCCLPTSKTGSAFTRSLHVLIPADHNISIFGAPSHGLCPCSPRLRTSIAGLARLVPYWPAG
jgi:hypothetical protein